MGIFDRLKRRSIQATEGTPSGVSLENMIFGQRLNTSVPGTLNAYTSYDAQVNETYRKYNSFAQFGCQQLRSIIDLRTAFIGGEGISVSCEDEATSNWIEKFLDRNRMNGANFINAVKGGELAGQSLMFLKMSAWIDGNEYVKMLRIPYDTDQPYKPVYNDKLTRDEVIDILIKNNDGLWISAGLSNYTYIRTGGDDVNAYGPVTKVGTVLTDLENYDRALKDIRRINHVLARITPRFKTTSDSETTALKKNLETIQWKIGQAFIGQADFDYATPDSGAHNNLVIELTATIKTISSVTGVPVHWLGYVDLMSNRSTAETLYELIKNATANERAEWEVSIYDLITKAQVMYIDSGGNELNKINYDFEVKLPLIDFGDFVNRVRGLSMAYADEAISIDDYRNALPGINPIKTKRALEKEREEMETRIMAPINPIIPIGNIVEDNEDEQEEPDEQSDNT